MEKTETSIQYGDSKIILSTGKMANLANGSVTATWGETVVLATVVVGSEPREDIDFLPLQVEYEERFYAAGKISGSRFIKREGRPSDQAVLAARQIDRPLRPLFPKTLRHDIQIIVTVLSYDNRHDPVVAGIIAASSALLQSGIPFNGPISASRVGKIEGKLVVNPAEDQIVESDLDLVVAGTKDRVMMIECAAKEVKEEEILQAIELGQQELAKAIDFQTDLKKSAELNFATKEELETLNADIEKFLGNKLKETMKEPDKEKRELKINEFEQAVLANFEGTYKQANLKLGFNAIVEKAVRQAILERQQRPDNRRLDEIRPLEIQVGLLPRTHGSALFSRGQTQSLTIVTLGAPEDEQTVETMEEEGVKRYMHHYNFPPYSTGEVKNLRSVSRREIGHGILAEKALTPMLPSKEDFPYTIRVVSEILSSNGSSSMAATCGSTLALMDAGVKIKKPVAGIAIGLITPPDFNENPSDDFVILTDIAGLEDFAGDMDFKVAGTDSGITAIQMDTKLKGLTSAIIKQSLAASQKARLEILEKIKAVISAPRPELSPFAPRIEKLVVEVKRISEVIGPGGKTIRKIIDECGGREVISINIEDSGLITITSTDPALSQKAIKIIEGMTREIKVGEELEAEVEDFVTDRRSGKEIGAIAKIAPGKSGMIHISEISDQHVPDVSSQLKIGQKVKVKVVTIDEEKGRFGLSIKQVRGA